MKANVIFYPAQKALAFYHPQTGLLQSVFRGEAAIMKIDRGFEANEMIISLDKMIKIVY